MKWKYKFSAKDVRCFFKWRTTVMCPDSLPLSLPVAMKTSFQPQWFLARARSPLGEWFESSKMRLYKKSGDIDFVHIYLHAFLCTAAKVQEKMRPNIQCIVSKFYTLTSAVKMVQTLSRKSGKSFVHMKTRRAATLSRWGHAKAYIEQNDFKSVDHVTCKLLHYQFGLEDPTTHWFK